MRKRNMQPWMQKIATIHAMNEAATKNLDAKAILESWGNMHMNPDANFAGMGDPVLPNGTLNPDGTFSGTGNNNIGSGDMPSSTLPMAMAIAAQTIALELVPTVPISTALTILPYVNGVYSGGATNRNLGQYDSSRKLPRIMKANLSAATVDDDDITHTAKELFAFAAANPKVITIKVEGLDDKTGVRVNFTNLMSFYDKSPIFEFVYIPESYNNKMPDIYNTDSITYDSSREATVEISGNFKYDSSTDKFVVDPDATAAFEIKITEWETVKTYEDFVPYFTGVSKYSNGGYDKPATGYTPDYTLANLNPYLRSEGEVTPANKVSLEMASTKVDAKTIKIQGEITREQFQDMTAYGYDPYGFVNAILTNECTQRINFDILKALHTLGAKHAEQINFKANIVIGDTLHENTLTIQKQIVAKFNLASNIISTRSRVSPADWVVVSAGVGTAIMDMPTFLASPATTFASTTGNNAMYCIGTLGRLKVYVDPYLEFNSTQCLVGAIGTEQSPGLKFMPYILADQITYPSEGMGGQNVVSMTSRYAIAPAGMHPESLYLGFRFTLEELGEGAHDLTAVFPYLG